MTNKGTAYIFVFSKACPYLLAHITIVLNSWQFDAIKHAKAGLCVPYCLLLIGMRNKMVRNVFPNHQFKNQMFHSQIGTRNKTVLNDQFGNNIFLLKDRNSEQNSPNLPILGTACSIYREEFGTKTVLIYQYWEQCVPFTERNSEQKQS